MLDCVLGSLLQHECVFKVHSREANWVMPKLQEIIRPNMEKYGEVKNKMSRKQINNQPAMESARSPASQAS